MFHLRDQGALALDHAIRHLIDRHARNHRQGVTLGNSVVSVDRDRARHACAYREGRAGGAGRNFHDPGTTAALGRIGGQRNARLPSAGAAMFKVTVPCNAWPSVHAG